LSSVVVTVELELELLRLKIELDGWPYGQLAVMLAGRCWFRAVGC
jgi:hypothetical protein